MVGSRYGHAPNDNPYPGVERPNNGQGTRWRRFCVFFFANCEPLQTVALPSSLYLYQGLHPCRFVSRKPPFDQTVNTTAFAESPVKATRRITPSRVLSCMLPLIPILDPF